MKNRINSMYLIALTLAVLSTIACEKDEISAPEIKLMESGVNLIRVNGCNNGGSFFDAYLVHKTSEEVEIDQLLFDYEFSDGQKGNYTTANFKKHRDEIRYDHCITYGTINTALTYKVTAIGKDASGNRITSNTVTYTVEKPTGGN